MQINTKILTSITKEHKIVCTIVNEALLSSLRQRVSKFY